ncbi:uncharacterized protein LOC112089662 isoform X2 [Eutrema salsugineum]|nr:uncharacterized protein LOC112089662 isoform X2 [Eutrema salsugineum]
MNLLGDVFPSMNNSFTESASVPTENHSKQKEAFDDLFSECNEALYDGCQSFSKLSFMLKLYHIKCLSRISDRGMSMIIDLLKEAFGHAKLPGSFNDMKKIIRKLGFTYETIHVCPNDCMLYWGNDASRDTCKVCESSRWKTSTTSTTADDMVDKKKKKKKQPTAKILRYFPLKPRLQRFFMSSKSAEYMRWHDSSENKDGKLRHPRDGKAWKTFNQQFPEFASDPRNVRLRLATDGFNPFGSMSTNYSVWPVLLVPYNFPPWMSMKETSMILSMVIPGKHMPGNDIDIYLQPLIQELKELWSDGVPTFDASLKEIFNMCAVLLWTISDFPGLGNLSGWNIHTGLACPSCNYDATKLRLHHGKKNCFMGHRRFLPQNHSFRKDKHHFDGFIETREAPITPSGTVIPQKIQDVDVTLGKKVDSTGKKRHRQEAGKSQWRKSSIFFELPYWKHLLLRHNLDLMHIEKNAFDNLIFTLLDDKGKSKDNLSARKDLQELGIRKELWSDENGRYLPACFTMTTHEKDRFLNILKSVKVPNGYSSNISSCVDINQRKIVGLKSHDCHILMGQLLSIAIRNVLPREVSFVITELCYFFRDISTKVLDIEDVDKLQDHIALTLCHLEMVFPLSFFTVMVHLTIRLTEEVKLGGPVQFRWMYPIER